MISSEILDRKRDLGRYRASVLIVTSDTPSTVSYFGHISLIICSVEHHLTHIPFASQRLCHVFEDAISEKWHLGIILWGHASSRWLLWVWQQLCIHENCQTQCNKNEPCWLSMQNMPTTPVYAITPPLTPEAQKVSNKQGRVSEKVIDREREKRKMQATAFVHPIVAEPIW